jgi:hypothetical protein
MELKEQICHLNHEGEKINLIKKYERKQFNE